MFWYLATVGYVHRVSQCKGGMFWYLATVGYVHRVSQCKGGMFWYLATGIWAQGVVWMFQYLSIVGTVHTNLL